MPVLPTLGILTSFHTGSDSYELYVAACKDLGVPYKVVDLIGDEWIDNIRRSGCDAFLARPTPFYVPWKQMFDEKLYHIERNLNRIVYPCHAELLLYENKRHMAYFLSTKGIPGPKTHVFYNLEEALDFTGRASYPLVFKTHLGAQARGVEILRNKGQAQRLVRQVFRRGYYRKIRTKLKGLLRKPIMLPYYFFDPEYKVVLLQEYLPDVSEWRMIRIGDSYFGHQKLKQGEFHSGSGEVGWYRPPDSLLEFTRHVCDTGRFWSMCLDVFEDKQGNYFVNELQAVFSSFNPSQMYVDGRPGRFRHNTAAGSWDFEEGYFCQNGSCNLRVEHLLSILGTAQNGR